jgi:predicted RND superfamily exporter protein
MTLLASWGVSRLEFDDVPRDVFRSSGDEYAELERFFADFASDDGDCLLVVEAPDIFSPPAAAALRELIERVKSIPGVRSVRSLADVVVFDGRPRSLLPGANAAPAEFSEARRLALAHPLVRGQVLAEEGRTALVIARLDADRPGVDDIQPVTDALNRVAAEGSADGRIRVRVTGVPPIRVEIYDMVRRETRRFVVIGVTLSFLMALFLFRQFWAAIIVASAPILASFWTMGALGLVGERMNVINTVLPTLILVVGFADAMHLMMDIRHSLADGHTPLEAAKGAIGHLFLACLLTSGTTAIGFGALSLAEVDIIRRFGLAASAGCALSFTAVMTVVPLLASTRLGEHVRAAHSQDFLVRHFGIFERGLEWILNHAWRVTVVGTILVVLLCGSLSRLEPDNRLVEMIPRDNDTYRALRHLDRVMGGSLSVFVIVQWSAGQSLGDRVVLDAIQSVERLLEGKPPLRYPLSVLGLLKSLPGRDDDFAARVPLLELVPQDVRERYVRTDRRRALVTARLPDIGSARSRPLFAELDQELARIQEHAPGVRLALTGTTVVGSRSVHQMIVSLNQSLLGAALAIFGAIAIGFRSIRLAAISVLPNLLPMGATAALLVVSGLPLQMTSVMVFSICLGIAVDDTIHFLNRFQRELAIDGDVRASIQRAFRAVGSAVITTTLVLLTGFGSVLTSEMPSSRLFGWLSCTAFATAVLGDLILLPALLLCFYRPKRVTARRRRSARTSAATTSSGESAAVASAADPEDDIATARR